MDIQKLARETGAILTSYRGNINPQLKGDGTVVTEADFAANKHLLEALIPTGATILSEETGFQVGGDTMYVIDPLDGTSGFANGRGHFSTMIGKVENGKVTEGVVYAPVEDELYYANNQGAWKNGVPITTDNKTRDLGLAIGSKGIPDGFVDDFNILWAIDYSSFGVRMSKIADGTIDLYMPFKKHTSWSWDVVAPYIIAKQAGAQVLSLGDKLDFTQKEMPGIIITNANDELAQKALAYFK